jgi:hypothetical protein
MVGSFFEPSLNSSKVTAGRKKGKHRQLERRGNEEEKRTLMVLVQIHQRKYLVDALLSSVLVRWQLDHLARHVVDRLNNLEHLVVGD